MLGLSRVIDGFSGAFPFWSYGGIDREERKHRKVLFLFKARQQIEKTNLDRAFAESRSGMIAHKNQKRITAGTHYETTFPYILPALALLQGETSISPTVLAVWTWFKVPNGPNWYYLACHSWILDDIDICGRGRHHPVSAGPNRLA